MKHVEWIQCVRAIYTSFPGLTMCFFILYETMDVEGDGTVKPPPNFGRAPVFFPQEQYY